MNNIKPNDSINVNRWSMLAGINEYDISGPYYDEEAEEEYGRKMQDMFDRKMDAFDPNEVIDILKTSAEEYPEMYPEGFLEDPSLSDRIIKAAESILADMDGEGRVTNTFQKLYKSSPHMAKSFLKDTGLKSMDAVDDFYNAIIMVLENN